jgi:hypothetical protein
MGGLNEYGETASEAGKETNLERREYNLNIAKLRKRDRRKRGGIDICGLHRDYML